MPETAALARLDRAGPATPSALARIERRRDPQDGRRPVMSVTQAGLQTLRERRNARTEQLAKALSAGFTQSELQQLMAAAADRATSAEHLMLAAGQHRGNGALVGAAAGTDDRYRWAALSNTTAVVFMSRRILQGDLGRQRPVN